jgi:hypothetical protein
VDHVLIDGRQLIGKKAVQRLDQCLFTFHIFPPL